MSESPETRPGLMRRIEILLPGLVVLLDQATKAIVRRTLSLDDSVAIVPGFLDFTHVRNSGAAFGILNAADFPFKTLVIAIVAAGALAAVVLYMKTLSDQQTLARIGLALILGGAIGNLIDRLLVGSVV